MSKLYEITSDYERAMDEYLTDPTNPEKLEILIGDFNNKAIAVAKYIKNLEAEKKAIEDATEEMDKRKKSLANKSKSLQGYLQYNIEKVGLAEKITCPYFSIYMKDNPEAVEITDEAAIPDAYVNTKETKHIDKNKLKADLKDGFEIEGARLTRGRTLVIK